MQNKLGLFYPLPIWGFHLHCLIGKGLDVKNTTMLMINKKSIYSPGCKIPTLHIQEINLFSIFKNQ